MLRRIVCAAIRNTDGDIICSARHYDPLMRAQIETNSAKWPKNAVEQGFIDQYGIFLSRAEALLVARTADQIIRGCGGDEDALYSENLY